MIDDNQGLFSFSSPCRVCGGRGVVDRPIRARRVTARGIERRPREVQARIPAGVADGQTIRLKGRGGPGRNGGPPATCSSSCHVDAAPACSAATATTSRCTVPVTFAEAALGGDDRRADPRRAAVTLRLRPGTQRG